MKILIVEDEKRMPKAVAHILRKNNYLVDIAGDGEYGLACALSGTYDIMLPLLDGISVLKELRNKTVLSRLLLC